MAKQLTALVTGASSGIGKETAKQLIEDGYKVYAAARRLEMMDDLKNLGAIPLKMDITKEEDIQNVFKIIEEESAGVDVLVNNAGFGSYGAMEDMSIEDARYQFEVNIFGLARVTQLALPYMRKQRSGHVINVSSIGGKIYSPLGSWYHATKHALEGWSDCIRLELAPFNVKVIIIEPGLILTEFADVVKGPLLERSGNSAYSDMVHSMLPMMEEHYSVGKGSHPSVISKTISKALKAKNPKTRYAAGKFAKLFLFARKWFGDKVYDKLISSMF